MTGLGTTPRPGRDSNDARSFWIRATIHRPITVFVLFLAILVVGLIAFPRIRTQMLPSGLAGSECGVWIPIRDSTPREVMEQVAKPTEDLLRTLPGLESIISSSGAQRCFIRLAFDPDRDIGLMVAEVRDRVERARATWPEGADEYRIWRQRDSDLPAYIASIGVEATGEIDLDWVFDEIIRQRIERLPGVARVDIWGLLEKRVEIALDKNRVAAHSIDIGKLVSRLTSSNRAITAGRIRDAGREYLVRVDGRFRSFDDILDWPIDERFRIGDVAEVGYATAVRDRLSRVNGEHARVLVVSKESNANAVEVCRRIEREIVDLGTHLRRTVPGVESVQSHSWLDQGELISSSVENLGQSGIYGGLCAVFVLYLFFRRFGMTMLVTLAIPFSLLITVIWLYFTGGSFNLLSLMGLSLAIGMLVDNSIVVVENILRHGERGLSIREAAIEGVREVGLAVALATLTTVMVMLPILFLGNAQFKTLTQALGAPLCISVLASLLVALVFIPQGALLLSRSRGNASEDAGESGPAPLGASAEAVSSASSSEDPEPAPTRSAVSPVNRLFQGVLRASLGRRVEALLGAGVLLWSTGFAFDWLPKAEVDLDGPRGVELSIELPKNFTLREADATIGRIEEALRERSERAGFEIEAITAWFDSGGGEMRVFFPRGHSATEAEYFAAVKPLPPIPGVTYHFGYESFSRDKGSQRIRVFIDANDYDALRGAEEVVQEALEDEMRFPELRDVARWSDEQRDEVRVEVGRRAAQYYGIDTTSVARTISWSIRGAPLPDFVTDEREYPFWIGFDDWQKESIDELDSILVFRPDGRPVRLENVATYALTAGSGDIHRRDGKLTAGLSVGVDLPEGSPRAVHEVRARVERHLRGLSLPAGAVISMRPPWGGFEEDLAEGARAMGMALALVFFIMGLLFESWLLPLSVLFCVPFAFFGSIWLLCACRVALDAVGLIGMLMLVGIVVNNAIVLVDYINRLRARGLGRRTAVLRAVEVRFRPIWMTASTTICGLLPLALIPSYGEGVDYRALAVVIIGGLTTSTFFTLIVVPLLYTVLDDARRVARAVWTGRPTPTPRSSRPTTLD